MHLQPRHMLLQAFEQAGQQGLVAQTPDHQRGHLDVTQGWRQSGPAFGRLRAQRRGRVVGARPGQAAALAPAGPVLRLHRFIEPAAVLVGPHAPEQGPKASEIVLGQFLRRVGAGQEVHVGAGRLLGRRLRQFARKNQGVRRVEDHQPLEQRGFLRRQIPGDGPTPVVGHQRRDARAAQGAGQCADVLHQMARAVGLHVGRRARTGIAAQVGRDAAVAAMAWLAKVQQQVVPDKSPLRKAVQEQHEGPTWLAGGAAGQGDAMRQREIELLDAGHAGSAAGICGWIQCQRVCAACSTPWRLRAENI